MLPFPSTHSSLVLTATLRRIGFKEDNDEVTTKTQILAICFRNAGRGGAGGCIMRDYRGYKCFMALAKRIPFIKDIEHLKATAFDRSSMGS
ncbi:uncharacterized protein G2W53_001060 [Senna tora]|uniref:Uncharacterized protein n=1 Tax=Senna tora TaxID=362788 RepID=A0A835CL60_9FABA|nr:uncharacterized protein G2W53_001060 [Senna tora]